MTVVGPAATRRNHAAALSWHIAKDIKKITKSPSMCRQHNHTTHDTYNLIGSLCQLQKCTSICAGNFAVTTVTLLCTAGIHFLLLGRVRGEVVLQQTSWMMKTRNDSWPGAFGQSISAHHLCAFLNSWWDWQCEGSFKEWIKWTFWHSKQVRHHK